MKRGEEGGDTGEANGLTRLDEARPGPLVEWRYPHFSVHSLLF